MKDNASYIFFPLLQYSTPTPLTLDWRNSRRADQRRSATAVREVGGLGKLNLAGARRVRGPLRGHARLERRKRLPLPRAGLHPLSLFLRLQAPKLDQSVNLSIKQSIFLTAQARLRRISNSVQHSCTENNYTF